MRLTLLLLPLLAACAAHPPFQKLDDGTGYVAKETPIPEILELRFSLPPNTREEYRDDYAARAAGEECAARKLPYFDVGLTKDGKGGRAFCYARDHAPTLGATFGMVAAPHGDPELRVTGASIGKHSSLNPWDVVRKVDGRPVHDVAELKETVFLLARKGRHDTFVDVERSEIPLHFQNKVFTDAGAAMSPDTLEALRGKVP